ncbi:preprotein translocase subunit SecE [Tumebacillus permanentifrigoris]|uniref:Protein translocase subunit SecE n=1 Tax=Tumebacillus permanentifrigoris TaxID=378543 RepID=A0A316D396_9BACL|nr:preprotein translocase subunit SecE [Tumebacillus permanentifrigoris]PWK05660.1 preprotein translocase subunit SecE [Tumebacillus permanentifrigoris]
MAGSSTVAPDAKQPRPNVFKRTGLFFKDAWGELKRVRWPNRKELVSYTMVVLGTCIFMILLVFAFDLGISYLLRLIGLGK